MCNRCYNATGKLLTTILAAGAPAVVADNAAKCAKLTERGRSISDDDRTSMEATERALTALAEMSRILTTSQSPEERTAALDGLLLHDPEYRIDPFALMNLCRFAHYASGLLQSIANMSITACQVRATSELDRLLVEFTLGNEGRTIERDRQDWNRREAEYDGIVAGGGDPSDHVAVVVGDLHIDRPGYATPPAPDYKH